MYTREHASIVYGDTGWGAPWADVQIAHPNPDYEYRNSRWHLVTSKGMPDLPATRSDGQPWTYHLHRTDGCRGVGIRGEWYGVTSNEGLEDSIDELLTDLTAWEAELELRSRVEGPLYALRNQLDRIHGDGEQTWPRSIRKRWDAVELAFYAAQQVLFEPPTRPQPPLHPWAAIIGYFGRETTDHRIWDVNASLSLRHDKSMPMFDTEHGLVGHVDHLYRAEDGAQWAFGWTHLPQIAQGLNDGSRWAGVDLSPDTEVDHSGGKMLFLGDMLVHGIHVQNSRNNPWTEEER